MNTGQNDLGDFSLAAQRHLRTSVYIAAPLLAIFTGIALGMPDQYRSTGVIRIDNSLGNDNRSLDTYAEYYVETLAGQVSTSTNLNSWIEKLELYQDKSDWSLSEKVAELRDSLKTTIVTTPVIDPNSGREREVVTGFAVSGSSPVPEEAKKIASAAVSGFLEENRRSRQERGQEEIDFFKREAELYRSQIADVEERLAEFKERNSRKLPELMEVNMSAMERVERDIESTQLQIESLKRERVVLQSQLNQVPNTSDEAIRQLAELQNEYVRVSAIYQDSHPNVVSIRKQIELLSQTVDSAAAIPILQQQRDEIAVALAKARERYSDDHPTVRQLLRSESALRERIAALGQSGPGARSDVVSTNDLYVQLETQIKAIDIQLNGLGARLNELRAKRAEYEELLFQTPQVEREYQELSRDLSNARKLYEETQEKQRQAELALALESSATGERLVLAQEPFLPKAPAWPPRIPIFIVGVILALSASVGVATLRELTSSTVRNSADVLEICGTPPMSLIPVMYNGTARVAKRFRDFTFFIAVLAICTISYVGSHAF